MFRLIKLAFYALVGYALYEFYVGMTQEAGTQSTSRGNRGGGAGRVGRRLPSDAGRMGTLTGPGRGATESVADLGGAEMRHTVGRGVVSTNKPR